MSAPGRMSTETEGSIHAPSTRPAQPHDLGHVMSLIPRLIASVRPAWRDPRKMLAAYTAVIGSILHAPRIDAALLIAEDGRGTPFGFVLLVAATDCFTHERLGHVAQIVVVDPQDMAAGLALIDAGESWARSRGYRVLTLCEFRAHHPARVLCQNHRFVEAMVKYRKAVR